MKSFWRLWAGPISDRRLASRIIAGAALAQPAMYVMTLAALRLASSKLGYEPGGPPYGVIPVMTLGGLALLGAWLALRTSRIASVLIVLVATTAAAAVDYVFATWVVVRTMQTVRCCGLAFIDASFWIFFGAIFFIAAGWSVTALLSWRAVMATFAAKRLRSSAPARLEEAFD